MNSWLEPLRRALRGRYVTMLEEELARARAETDRQRADAERERAEIARLREENRAMLNSLLGIAGAPPVEVPRAAQAAAPPIRRRSWPQFSAAREMSAARKSPPREQL